MLQTAKIYAATMEEKARNTEATTNAEITKTVAKAQEKIEIASAHDPEQKEKATKRMEDTIKEAERNKQAVVEENAAAEERVHGAGIRSAVEHGHESHGEVRDTVIEKRDVTSTKPDL